MSSTSSLCGGRIDSRPLPAELILSSSRPTHDSG